MSDPATGATSPSVKLSARYLFTDDAIVDAMQLVTALTQFGLADRVKGSISGVMWAKRALATEKWTRTAEADFWTSFGQLAHAAREVGVLNGPVPEPVRATGFLLSLRKLVTFPGAVVVAVALVVMCGWLWAKTLAETVDNDRVNLRGCLVTGSEKKGADEIAAVVFGDPAKPGTLVVKPDYQATLDSCAHVLAALENKLGEAQLVVGAFYLLPSAAEKIVKAHCPERPDNAVFCQWMFAYISPANDALGLIVKAFAMFILPPLLGALGAWSFTIRQMIRNPASDMTRSRLGDRRHWLNMMFGAMLGAGFALWATPSGGDNGPPSLFASMPPFIVAFIAGYGRDFIFAWMDGLLGRLPSRRGEVAQQPTESQTVEHVEPPPAEPRLVQTNRAVGGT